MKRCKKCGVVKPYEDFHRLDKSSDGRQPSCRICVGAYMHEYHQRNAEKIRAKVKAWKVAHPERKKQLDRLADKRHKARKVAALRAKKVALERCCERCGKFIEPSKRIEARFCSETCQAVTGVERNRGKNPEAERERRRFEDRRRRARKRGQFVEDVDPLVVLEFDDGICGICGRDVDPTAFDVDHVIPLARGGEHSYANTQVAHPTCNRRKHARLPDEMPVGVGARY